MKSKMIIFTGAGISAESGVPTFRTGDDGLWLNHKVEDVATSLAIKNNPEVVIGFHNMLIEQFGHCEPNYAHKQIAALEADYDVTVVTTNIDDLHERAGSTKVIHLHGQLNQACDIKRQKPIPWSQPIKMGDLHPETGRQLRHDTVLFGEDLRVDAYDLYREYMSLSKLLVVGSNLSVYPAASIVDYFNDIIILDAGDNDFKDIVHDRIKKSACDGIDEALFMFKKSK